MTRFAIEWAVQREHVALREQFVERAHTGDADGLVRAIGQIGVVKNDLEAERLRPQRRCGADATETNDAEGELAQATQTRLDLNEPAEAFRFSVEREKLTAEGHGERDGVIGDLLGAVVGHVAHGDAALACGGDVHAVEADAVADDGAAVFQPRDAFRRQRHVVPDDDRVALADFIREIGVGFAEKAAQPGVIADDAALDGGIGIALRRGGPVDDGDAWHEVRIISLAVRRHRDVRWLLRLVGTGSIRGCVHDSAAPARGVRRNARRLRL